MARLFVPPEKLQGDKATLDESAHRHLVKVLRLGPGARFGVFDGRGTEIEARIEAVGWSSVDIALGARHQLPAPACAITLLQSPPRGDRMDLVVQKTTELGVARIVPVVTERGMPRLAADSQNRRRRWQAIAKEAARQSGRADVPEVADIVALADALGQISVPVDSRFILWEEDRAQSFRQALAHGPRQVAVLVGPEGGFPATEVALCRESGFEVVGLGSRVLRSETAAIVAVALAQAAAGGLD
jgi:16S rRNA (uracil1498-N3)-methyltransferase